MTDALQDEIAKTHTEITRTYKLLSCLTLIGPPKGRVVPAMEVVQYHRDTCGLGQQAAGGARTLEKLD